MKKLPHVSHAGIQERIEVEGNERRRGGPLQERVSRRGEGRRGAARRGRSGIVVGRPVKRAGRNLAKSGEKATAAAAPKGGGARASRKSRRGPCARHGRHLWIRGRLVNHRRGGASMLGPRRGTARRTRRSGNSRICLGRCSRPRGTRVGPFT